MGGEGNVILPIAPSPWECSGWEGVLQVDFSALVMEGR